MQLAGIELKYLVDDIGKRIDGYYISNIYGITKNSLLFKFHHPEKPDILLMLSTFGIWMTKVKIGQIEENKLLRRLRDDLLRFKLKEIKQVGTERIVYLTFSYFDKELVVITELFGDGNIIVCNSEMKILAMLHSINVRHRQLRVGSQYIPPPQNNLDVLNMTDKDFEVIRSTSIPVAKWVGKTLGLPRKYAEEITRLAKVESKKKGDETTNEEVRRLFNFATQIINDVVSGKHDPEIVRNDEIDVNPISIKGANCEKIPSFMDGLDTVFTESIITKGKTVQGDSFDKKISELETKLDEQTKAVKTVTEKSQSIANVANLLFEALSQGILTIDDTKIISLLKKKNSEIIKEKGISYIKINDAKIKVNLNSSLPTIASTLFNESKKQKSAIVSIEKLIKKTQSDLEKVIEKGESTKKLVSFSEVRKKNWFERYRWFYTIDGVLAVGGRDSSSNTAIIRRHLEKNDKVFHAEISGSPFFLLKDNDTATLASLTEVAHATVCFSKIWREPMYGSSAYWVNPEQVKKAAPSGQSMAKGSFMIEGQRNFVKISTLKMCVAIIEREGIYLLTCGPPSLKNNCICYAIIEPEGSDMPDVAKKIRLEFLSSNEDVAKSFSIDEYVRVMPAGPSRIIESGS